MYKYIHTSSIFFFYECDNDNNYKTTTNSPIK